MREGNAARRIGALDVPVVGVGCNSFGTWADAASSTRVVHAALDAGAVLFDTADYYGGGARRRYSAGRLRDVATRP